MSPEIVVPTVLLVSIAATIAVLRYKRASWLKAIVISLLLGWMPLIPIVFLIIDEESPVKPKKDCPDCAETIFAAAKVCKHCGFRFAPRPHSGGA